MTLYLDREQVVGGSAGDAKTHKNK